MLSGGQLPVSWHPERVRRSESSPGPDPLEIGELDVGTNSKLQEDPERESLSWNNVYKVNWLTIDPENGGHRPPASISIVFTQQVRDLITIRP